MFSFVNPFLLSGLALISIPIIIHLLHRHQVKEMEWATMQFLQEIIEEQQKRLRLEDLLLLVLRVLMFAFLVLALARLGFKKGSVPVLGDRGDSLLVVDASYSMATKQGPRTRFDAACSKADAIIRELPKGHGVSLAKGSEQSETVLGGNLADHDLVRETVKEMQVTDFAGRPDKLVGYIREFTKKSPSVDQTVFLVSDFQEQDWGSPSEGLKSALTELCEKHTVVFVPVGDGSDANLFAADLTLLQGAVRVGQTAHFAGAVLNQGSEIAEDVPVELVVDGETIETRTLSIGPGQTAEVLFSHPIARLGQRRAVLKVGQDSNPADNKRYLSFEAHDRLRVLAVVDQPPLSCASTLSARVRRIRVRSTASYTSGCRNCWPRIWRTTSWYSSPTSAASRPPRQSISRLTSRPAAGCCSSWAATSARRCITTICTVTEKASSLGRFSMHRSKMTTTSSRCC